MKHVFAVVAYGDSEYLESCLKSLKAQTVKSDVILCTSTPSDYIRNIAAKYNIPIYVRIGEPGIANDWNFAYEVANADLVTLAHQDDMYKKDYAATMLDAKKEYPDMSLFTAASVTVKGDKIINSGKVEIIKKLLRTPLRATSLAHMATIKKAAIRFGNPIICPSCTYDKKLCGSNLFDSKYQFILDWDALYRLAEKDGRWVCCEMPLIMYRVHSDAATGEAIRNHIRETEESEMFDRLLPQKLAGFVKKKYKKSYEAYD